MTDKQLAAFAYLIADIPISEWAAHWRIDSRTHHGDLTAAARKAYLAIWRSTRAV